MRRFVLLGPVLSLVIVFSFVNITHAEPVMGDVAASIENNESIPFRQQTASSEVSFPYIAVVFFLGIGVCIAVAVVLQKTLQRKGVLSAVPGTRVSVKESKRISPKITLFLVMVDDIEYLLVQSGDQVQLQKHVVTKIDDESNA